MVRIFSQSFIRRARRNGLAFASASCLALAWSVQASAQVTPINKVVVFGDSISDGGSYADRAPSGAGSFTTNPDPVWVEVIAGGLGLDLTPHATEGGTNYAEGGARVLVARAQVEGGLSRRSLSEQINDFLSHGGALDANSLVIIQGGGNDVFATQTNGKDFTAEDLLVLDQAAKDLADQLVQIKAAGAGAVVTVSVPKFDVFNDRYEAQIKARGVNVLYVDIAGLIAEMEENPSEFGLVNVTDPACKGRAVESFVCLPADYVTPDANRTYLYADGVHFTGIVHEIEGQAVLATLAAPGQISQLAQLVHAGVQSDHAKLQAQLRAQLPDAGSWSVFGGGSGESVTLDAVRPPLDGDARGAYLGAEYGFGRFSAGAMLSRSRGDGTFGSNAGAYDVKLVSLTAFGRGRLGAIDAAVDASYGAVDFDDIRRRIVLGPAVREEVGRTSGHLVSVGAELGMAQQRGDWRMGPVARLRYESVRLDAYAEAGDRSTQIAFGGQELETLTASFGLSAQNVAPNAAVRPFAKVSYEAELLDRTPLISITPHGAPVSFTSRAYAIDGDYIRYSLGAEAKIAPAASVIAGVSGVAARQSADAFGGFVGLRLTF